MKVKYKGVSSLNKKIIGIILVLMVGLLLPAIVSANVIGYVDFEFLFYAHPEYDVKNKELQEDAEKLYLEVQAKAEELEAQEEIDELSAYYEWQFDQIEQEVRVELVAFILKIIEEVATANNISTVMPESSVIYGGVNITVEVVEAMYKAYGISVPVAIRELM